MSRYVRAAPQRASWWDDDNPLLPNLVVSDSKPVDTGLVWADGSTIWRAPNPIGFGRNEEWL